MVCKPWTKLCFTIVRFGCCPNGITPATGPSFQGCYDCSEGSGECDSCLETTYGCCPDNVTAASGPDFAGCQDNCKFFFIYYVFEKS